MSEPVVALWDGENFIQKPLTEALKLVEEGKAQRVEEFYTGRGLVRRADMHGYSTRMLTADVQSAHVPEPEIVQAPRKRGRPRKEMTEVSANEAAVDDEPDSEG